MRLASRARRRGPREALRVCGPSARDARVALSCGAGSDARSPESTRVRILQTRLPAATERGFLFISRQNVKTNKTHTRMLRQNASSGLCSPLPTSVFASACPFAPQPRTRLPLPRCAPVRLFSSNTRGVHPDASSLEPAVRAFVPPPPPRAAMRHLRAKNKSRVVESVDRAGVSRRAARPDAERSAMRARSTRRSQPVSLRPRSPTTSADASPSVSPLHPSRPFRRTTFATKLARVDARFTNARTRTNNFFREIPTQ